MPDPTRWVTVASCGLISEAEANAAVLEAEGIETRIEDHDRSGLSRFATWMVAFPQIVLVREPDEERARELLGAVSTVSEAELEAEAMAAREEPPDEPAEGQGGAPRVLLVVLAAVIAIAFALSALAPRLEP